MLKIKLGKIDRRILAELDKNCRISNTQLGKRVNRSREAVKYRIQQLQKKGVISGFITSINPNKLGYYMFKAYLKLENIPEEKEKFFNELRNDKSIYWFGISDGAFDCTFAFLSRNITTYFEEINTFLSKWEHLIVSKVLGTMVDTRQYHKKLFTNDNDSEEVVFAGDIVSVETDDLDFKILDILANNARIPLTELSKKTKSTVEIVRRRIRQLEQKGVILSYRLSVDFNKLGLEFFKAIIYFRTLSKKDEIALFEWMRRHPKALYYIRSLAPWEVEFEFVVESYHEFNAIINELRERFPHVIRNHEHFIMSHEEWMPAYREMLKGDN